MLKWAVLILLGIATGWALYYGLEKQERIYQEMNV